MRQEPMDTTMIIGFALVATSLLVMTVIVFLGRSNVERIYRAGEDRLPDETPSGEAVEHE